MCRLSQLLVVLTCSLAEVAHAFNSNGRWSTTATNGATGPSGSPVVVTWSIAPNGTNIAGYGTSNLISSLDAWYGGGTGLVSQRPWFPLLQSSFARWSDLGGLAFVYEPADDGVALGNWVGALNVRGDIRLGGVSIDGPGFATGQTGFLDNADITLDTSDVAHFSDTAQNSIKLRNTLMHEIGHALGLGHIDSSTSAFLLEPFSDTSFDGPQIDDIRGLQQLYGDVYERGSLGNNNGFSTAADLGNLAPAQPIAIGVDATTGTVVASTETDFVSIANANDVDVFKFAVAAPALVTVSLTPTGPNYNERISGTGAYATTRSSRMSNLTLELYGPGSASPALIATANSAPTGQTESLVDLSLPTAGTYFVKVVGDANLVQLYHLSLTAASGTGPGQSGDFDGNGDVEGSDFLIWQRGLAPAGPYGAADLANWQTHFGLVPTSSVAINSVAEPNSLSLLALAGVGLAYRAISTCRSAHRRSRIGTL